MHLRVATTDDAAAIARIHVDTWRTTYSGIVPEAYLAKLSYEQRQSSWVQMLSSATKNNHFIYVTDQVHFSGLKCSFSLIYQTWIISPNFS